MKVKGADVMFVQETHSDSSNEPMSLTGRQRGAQGDIVIVLKMI